jgi:hypothetical protein
MRPTIDLGLILCAIGRHDPVRVADRSISGRIVGYLKCVRCSRVLPTPRRPGQDEQAPTVRPSHYS